MFVASGMVNAFHLSVCILVLTQAEQHPGHGRTISTDGPISLEYSDGAPVGWVSDLYNEHPRNVMADRHHVSFLETMGTFEKKIVNSLQDSKHAFDTSKNSFENNIQASYEMMTMRVRKGLGKIVFGVIFFMIAFAIQWYNEERSARMEILQRRGLAECVSVSAEEANQNNHGRLVHVQGWARGTVPLSDRQFQNAQVTKCLKLQSTLEVFEWIQTTRTLLDGNEKWTQPRFHTEWTTIHQDSQRFRKPSPENPRLPSGILLGTFTQVCPRIELGAFVLTKDMVNPFLKFNPAMKYLPQTLLAHGFTFFANPEDGYYYMRPGVASLEKTTPNLLSDHQVGDVRARFMCVPDCEATIVAVQCQADFEGGGTFVPYRPISQGPCITDCQVREKRIEEGGRPLMDVKADIGCRPRGLASCCACCTCNAIAVCCQAEKVTEEIFYVSDRFEPLERPFDKVVPRNPCRVWLFRLIGWGLMYLGIAMVLGPFAGTIEHAPGLTAYGSAAAYILSAIVTLSVAGIVMALAYAFYQPIMILKWLLFVILIILVPLLWGGLSPYAKMSPIRA